MICNRKTITKSLEFAHLKEANILLVWKFFWKSDHYNYAYLTLYIFYTKYNLDTLNNQILLLTLEFPSDNYHNTTKVAFILIPFHILVLISYSLILLEYLLLIIFLYHYFFLLIFLIIFLHLIFLFHLIFLIVSLLIFRTL
jgi:hypothetical protein